MNRWCVAALVSAVLLTGCAPGSSTPASPAPTATLHGAASPLNDPTGIALDRLGNLWVANYRGNSIVMYRAKDVRKSGAPIPAIVISGGHSSVDGPNRMVFDDRGYLWVANYSNDTVVAFSPDQLQRGGDLPASISIGQGARLFDQPTGLAFDAQGNLWVTNQRGDDIVKIAASDLRTGGNRPAVRLPHAGGAGGTLEAVTFDHSGHLWLARYGDNRVVSLAPSQLTASQSIEPDREIGQLNGPIGLTFDSAGRLWVAEAESSTVAGFVPSNSGGSSAIVSLAGPAVQTPHSLAFDSAGDLWMSCNNNTLVMFSAAQIAGGSASQPAVVLSSPH